MHSIVAQSLRSPLGAEPVNGDGFGVGWYPSSGDGPPGVFRSIERDQAKRGVFDN